MLFVLGGIVAATSLFGIHSLIRNDLPAAFEVIYWNAQIHTIDHSFQSFYDIQDRAPGERYRDAQEISQIENLLSQAADSLLLRRFP
ncbi:hypothetical protein J4460_04060 [Candidatus Woesearchaeota archaeon]|nr:hypothetical protein [Candidatus Woesearchaeota archaeon]HIH38084.1 hypothetical protein [Candidatus Woesearchaeota archaeon]HIJ03183.1 hypothetical protein [Candidatus Woesearchaeota archaeon]